MGITKPMIGKGSGKKEAIVEHGVRAVGTSDFDSRNGDGVAPAYVGPSKTEGKTSAIDAGVTQKKKHKSTGKGQ